MLRVIYLMSLLALFLIPISLSALLPNHTRKRANIIIYRILARAFRIKVSIKGKISHKEPVMFVSNHMSYVDIMVLGASLPGSFVSKAEVKKWPLMGWIASLSGCVFVSRKRSGTTNQIGDLEKAIDSGKNLILFPEGTTSDGKGVLPFKSSLFKIAEARDITIQPVTITYTHINGLPIQANERVKIAWVGDAELMPHLNEFVNLGIVRAEVKIHEPLSVKGDRKQLAEAAHAVVADWKG